MEVTTVLTALKAVNAYPIPLRTLSETMEKRGLKYDTEATQGVLTGKAYNLAVADLLIWLALAPNITQGGQSYSFTDEQRDEFRRRARLLYDEFDDDDEGNGVSFGYKGEFI